MSEFSGHVAALLYFMLPAYAANMAPPFVRFWKGWNRPIHARLLGQHKTVVGFSLGVVAGVATAGLQSLLSTDLAMVDYSRWPLLGGASGIGAMLGDSLKSLVKRRIGIPPGGRWLPFDQVDFVLGSLLLVRPFVELSWADAVMILAITFAGDIAVNRLAFACGIKDTPW